MLSETLYHVLEVSPEASQDLIRASWERLSTRWDPTDPNNTNREARARYSAITDAYLVLGNPQKRAAYDKKIGLVVAQPNTKTPAAMPTLEAIQPRSVSQPSKSRIASPTRSSPQHAKVRATNQGRDTAQQSKPRSKLMLALVATLAMGAYQYQDRQAQSTLDTANGDGVEQAEAKIADASVKSQVAYLEQQSKRALAEEQQRRGREAEPAKLQRKERFDQNPNRAAIARSAEPQVVAALNKSPARTDMALAPQVPSTAGASSRTERFEPVALMLDTELGSSRQHAALTRTQR